MRYEIIYGPPGTGKTTALVGELQRTLLEVPIERVMYVSFTRAAIKAAIETLRGKPGVGGNLSRDKLAKIIRTIHSLSFALAGISKDEVLTDYSEFTKEFGFRMSMSKDEKTRHADGDPYLHMYGLIRATGQEFWPLKKKYRMTLPEERYRKFEERYEAYKAREGKIDFSDMLEMYVDRGASLDVDAAFIDEAQDLTPQQWRVVNKAFAGAKRIVVAGDDDQAVFSWAGADPTAINRLGGEVRTLKKSHRLPSHAANFAQWLSKDIDGRMDKEWGPRDGEEVFKPFFNAKPPYAEASGSWLLLARNEYRLMRFRQEMDRCSLPYFANGQLFMKYEAIRAILVVLRWRGGVAVKPKELQRAANLCGMRIRLPPGDTVRIRPEDPGIPIESEFTPAKVNYIHRIASAGRDPLKPRHAMMTMHAAKGLEADNVVLDIDVSQAVYENLKWPASRSDELRVLYVGVTRARQRLWILAPETSYSYSDSIRRALRRAGLSGVPGRSPENVPEQQFPGFSDGPVP